MPLNPALREWNVRNTVVGLLSCLIIAQVGLYATDAGSPPVRVPIEPGMPFPFTITPIADDPTSPTSGFDGCRVGFLCSTGCRFCNRLASSIQGEVSGLPNAGPVWLMASPPDQVQVWAAELGVPVHSVFAIDVRDRTWRSPGYYGHIWMTPMRVILAHDGTVLDIRPSDELPDDATLASICGP
jgi:hypothetical protein